MRRRPGRGGAGRAGWAGTCARLRRLPANPLAPQAAAFRRPRRRASSSCSWPARRATWSCSTTSRSWPSATASCRRPSCSRATGPRSSIPNSQAAGAEVQVRQARPVRRGAVGAAAAPGRPSSTTSPSSSRWRPTPSTTRPAQILMNTGIAAVRPAEHRLVGHVRPGQRVAGPARRSSSSAPARRAPAAATRNWGSGFLPTVYQGVQFRGGGEPVLYLSQPARRRSRSCSATRSTRSARSTSMRLGAGRRSGDRHPHQLRSRWPSACRPAPRS